MAIDKKTFLKAVTILYDTREQKNQHILTALAEMGVQAEERKQYKGVGPVLYVTALEPAQEPEEEVVTFN